MTATGTIKRLRKSGHYRTKKRLLSEIVGYGGDFYERIYDSRGGFLNIPYAYEGMESSPKKPSQKIPNITTLWNLPFNRGGYMFASTMGHHHPPGDFPIQEIYEFLGYGTMLISSEKETVIYLCRPGSKLTVPPDCSMTILNLSHQKLTTIDMANPKKNKSDKTEIEQKGPMIAIYNTGSSPYSEEVSLNQGSYRLPLGGTVKMVLNSRYQQLGLRKDAIVEFRTGIGAESLLEKILEKERELKELGIRVSCAEQTLEIETSQKRFSIDSLERISLDSDKLLHHILGIME
ncbi:hypothetical protein GF386_04460 [Candidatus Pacearchaeota archaeon]|nr:hypothetical protein [Candidatus Pacearchaeota archaeon]MBD3283377.1 hypothetical protein [Candidatus Pacearchaeota archaeon]